MATIKKIVVNSRFEDPTNCYVIYDPDNLENFEAIIIDPGGNPEKYTLVEKIEHLNIQVKHVVLTHCHADHWLEVFQLIKRFNPDIWMCGYDLILFENVAIAKMAEELLTIKKNEINNSDLSEGEKKAQQKISHNQFSRMKFFILLLIS